MVYHKKKLHPSYVERNHPKYAVYVHCIKAFMIVRDALCKRKTDGLGRDEVLKILHRNFDRKTWITLLLNLKSGFELRFFLSFICILIQPKKTIDNLKVIANEKQK